MKSILNHAGLLAAICSLVFAGSASAIVTVSGSVGGAPTGVKHLNLDDLVANASGAMSTTGPNGPISLFLTPNAQVAVGGSPGVYAPPYLSGLNGLGFASQVGPGADTTSYLTSGRDGSGDTGQITISFGSPNQYFGLLWGSIDSYNTIRLYSGGTGGTLVGTVTGTDVIGSPNGDQGVLGTLYVNINSTLSFDTVVITSSAFAFELDNLAYNETTAFVPEGGMTLAMLGMAVAGLGVLRRKA